MIPKEAIEKAIEEGWQDYERVTKWLCENPRWEDHVTLDPSFWQALGKPLGWHCAICVHDGNWGIQHPRCDDVKDLAWQTRARNFYDLILTGGDTKKFWTDLLADPKGK